MREVVAAKIEEIAQQVAQSEGLELVEVEVKGGGNARFVRIAIDKPEGVTHADCGLVSEKVGTRKIWCRDTIRLKSALLEWNVSC